MTKQALIAALQKLFDHFGLGPVLEVKRTYAGRNQRSDGAWSWCAGRQGKVGSQYPVKEVLAAFKRRCLSVHIDAHDDANLYPDVKESVERY